MNIAIIVGAGKSARMQTDKNKIFLELLGKPLIYYALKTFNECDAINQIIVVVQKDEIQQLDAIKRQNNFDKIKMIVEGGKERQDSVFNGLKAIEAKKEDVIIIHNGSNPFVRVSEITDCIDSAERFGAAACCFPLKDTIKKVKEGFVEQTIERQGVYQMQTPQAIKYELLKKAYENAQKQGLRVTDDVMLVEAMKRKVRIVECSYENIKVTTQDDLKIAESIISNRSRPKSEFLVGFGQDSHKFTKNRRKELVLGGYIVPKAWGLEADSDGDVILHALFSAISQAIGEKSLGFYAAPLIKKKIKDSKEYLKIILGKLKERNLVINNIGISIEALTPNIDAHADKIRRSLSNFLEIESNRIGINSTSGDRLTSFGRGIGIQCFVIVSLRSSQ